MGSGLPSGPYSVAERNAAYPTPEAAGRGALTLMFAELVDRFGVDGDVVLGSE